MNSEPDKLPSAQSTAPNLTDSTKTPGRSTDERVFLGAVIVGSLFILAVTAFILFRNFRESSPVSLNKPGQPPRRLVDFSLTDRTGRVVNRAELEQQFLVVNFVFTGCDIGCLLGADHMAQLQQKLKNDPDVRLVSLTIDPGSDTPEVLAKFAQRFKADTNKWLFLTGDRKAVYPVIEQSFLGPPDKTLRGSTPGGYTHTDFIFLVDKQGVVREKFHGNKSAVVNQITKSIQSLRGSGG